MMSGTDVILGQDVGQWVRSRPFAVLCNAPPEAAISCDENAPQCLAAWLMVFKQVKTRGASSVNKAGLPDAFWADVEARLCRGMTAWQTTTQAPVHFPIVSPGASSAQIWAFEAECAGGAIGGKVFLDPEMFCIIDVGKEWHDACARVADVLNSDRGILRLLDQMGVRRPYPNVRIRLTRECWLQAATRRVDGGSCGGAMLLAVLGAISGRRVPFNLLVSIALAPGGGVASVGGLAEKLVAFYAWKLPAPATENKRFLVTWDQPGLYAGSSRNIVGVHGVSELAVLGLQGAVAPGRRLGFLLPMRPSAVDKAASELHSRRHVLVSGGPGSGKQTMADHVEDRIEPGVGAVVRIDLRRSTPWHDQLLRSWVLALQSAGLEQHVARLLSDYERARAAGLDAQIKMLTGIPTALLKARCLLRIDRMDACPPRDVETLNAFIAAAGQQGYSILATAEPSVGSSALASQKSFAVITMGPITRQEAGDYLRIAVPAVALDQSLSDQDLNVALNCIFRNNDPVVTAGDLFHLPYVLADPAMLARLARSNGGVRPTAGQIRFDDLKAQDARVLSWISAMNIPVASEIIEGLFLETRFGRRLFNRDHPTPRHRPTRKRWAKRLTQRVLSDLADAGWLTKTDADKYAVRDVGLIKMAPAIPWDDVNREAFDALLRYFTANGSAIRRDPAVGYAGMFRFEDLSGEAEALVTLASAVLGRRARIALAYLFMDGFFWWHEFLPLEWMLDLKSAMVSVGERWAGALIEFDSLYPRKSFPMAKRREADWNQLMGLLLTVQKETIAVATDLTETADRHLRLLTADILDYLAECAYFLGNPPGQYLQEARCVIGKMSDESWRIAWYEYEEALYSDDPSTGLPLLQQAAQHADPTDHEVKANIAMLCATVLRKQCGCRRSAECNACLQHLCRTALEALIWQVEPDPPDAYSLRWYDGLREELNEHLGRCRRASELSKVVEQVLRGIVPGGVYAGASGLPDAAGLHAMQDHLALIASRAKRKLGRIR